MKIDPGMIEGIFEWRDGAALTLTTARVVIHVTRHESDEDGGAPYYRLSGAPLGKQDREYTDAVAAVAAALRVLHEYAS